MGPASQNATPSGPPSQGDVEDPAISRIVQSEAKHGMMSSDQLVETEELPTLLTSGAACDPVDTDGARQRQILQRYKMILDGSVKYARAKLKILVPVHNLMSAIELVFNSAIMLFENSTLIESSTTSAEVVAVCAACNAVLKGIDMKLQLDCQANECKRALQSFKKLKEKVISRIAQDHDFEGNKFSELQQGFQSMLSSYAAWMPESDQEPAQADAVKMNQTYAVEPKSV